MLRAWSGPLGPFVGTIALVALLQAPSAGAATAVAAVNTEEGIALKGFDPVAYFTAAEPTEGVAAYAYEWRGATYRFASAANLERFEADPERYLPQYGGYCAIAMAHNQIADVDPDRWAIVDGKLYLNNNLFAHALWSVNRRGNIEEADRNWSAYPKERAGG